MSAAVPISPAARMELLLQVWELRTRYDYPGLRTLLEGLGMARVARDLELLIPLAGAYNQLGQTSKARRLMSRALPLLARESHATRLRFLNAYANAFLLEGRVEEARPIVREYQAVSDAAGDDVHRMWSSVQGFLIAGNAADWVDALRWLQRGQHLAGSLLHGRAHLALLHHNLAITCRHLGLFAEAQRHHEEGARAGRPEWVAAHNHTERALLLNAVGDHDLARALAQRGIELHRKVGSNVGMAEGYTALAVVALATGDLAGARVALGQARAALDEPNLLVRGQIEEETAVLELLSGNARARRTAENRAAQLYTRMGAPRRVLTLRLRLAALESGTNPDLVVIEEQADALVRESTAPVAAGA